MNGWRLIGVAFLGGLLAGCATTKDLLESATCPRYSFYDLSGYNARAYVSPEAHLIACFQARYEESHLQSFRLEIPLSRIAVADLDSLPADPELGEYIAGVHRDPDIVCLRRQRVQSGWPAEREIRKRQLRSVPIARAPFIESRNCDEIILALKKFWEEARPPEGSNDVFFWDNRSFCDQPVLQDALSTPYGRVQPMTYVRAQPFPSGQRYISFTLDAQQCMPHYYDLVFLPVAIVMDAVMLPAYVIGCPK